jgi:hypothetical protein
MEARPMAAASEVGGCLSYQSLPTAVVSPLCSYGGTARSLMALDFKLCDIRFRIRS